MFKSACGVAVLLLAAVGAAVAAEPAKTPELKVLKTIPIGGEGKWDYLCPDAEGRKLFIPRSSHVQIINLDTGESLGDVPGTNGVHGVALAPEQGLGFASNGRDNAVTVFDLKTYKTSKTIKAGKNPDAIIYDPASKHIFAMNHSGGSITVIDPAALDKDPVTIEVGGALESGVADGNGHVFVNVEDKSEVVQIDSKANRVIAHWALKGGSEPTGLALDKEHHTLFVGCGNAKCVVLDSESGKQLAAVDAGKGIDGVTFDASLGVAITANGKDGTMTVVKQTGEGKFEAIQTVKTLAGARTINVDEKLHHALAPCMVPDGKGGTTFGICVVGAE